MWDDHAPDFLFLSRTNPAVQLWISDVHFNRCAMEEYVAQDERLIEQLLSRDQQSRKDCIRPNRLRFKCLNKKALLRNGPVLIDAGRILNDAVRHDGRIH